MKSKIMRIEKFLLFGLLCLIQDKATGDVSITTPTETYWGSDGDTELEIHANVTSDSGWENVIVTVTLPSSSVTNAMTEDTDSNSTWRIYTYTIKSLFIEDAGTYTFTVDSGAGEGSAQSENSSVFVYIYTVDIFYPETNYYAVERTETLTVSAQVRSDQGWDNIQVTLSSPNGDSIATTYMDSTFGPFWRFYSAEITNLVAGTYKFTASETLAGEMKTIESNANLEINAGSEVDEYLYRIQAKSSELVAKVTNFYNYLYDGPDSTYILDGGKDMYDRGNYFSVMTSEDSSTISVPYGKPYVFESYQFSSIATYPFTSLMWIANEDGSQDLFEFQVIGQTGVRTGSTSQSKSSFDVNSYRVSYTAFQVFDTSTDPSICEVYFHITNANGWSSVEPVNATLNVAGTPPHSLQNTYSLTGSVQNVLMGYTLLSRDSLTQVVDTEIEAVLREMTTLFQQKDALSVSSDESVLVSPIESSVTLTTRITASDWATSTVMVVTPTMVEQTLTEYEVDGDARVYSYTISSATERDSGTYKFRLIDGYGFQLETTTELSVLTATIQAPTSEYWGSHGDAELPITVSVEANDWTDMKVMVRLPRGSVAEAMTADTGTGARSYTYPVTNLFIEDAGEYSFYTSKYGAVSSVPQNVTVYIFSTRKFPDSFHSHITGKADKAVLMVYGICDGDWANVVGDVTTPSGTTLPLQEYPGQAATIKVFTTNITGVTAGDYTMTLTETLGTKTDSQSVVHTVEYHSNSTSVDEYLYRILLDSDKLVSYIPDWHTYWYDGSDYTHIYDGGDDMFNSGNRISLSWSTGELLDHPYGKPFDNGIVEFSSRSLYPFVSMMWIGNSNETEDEFSLSVKGKPGATTTLKSLNMSRILIEGTYKITYKAFQIFGSEDPSICEVYFLITNQYYWNSKEPTNFFFDIGGTPPQFIENTARVDGTPKNVMLGYTLLSRSKGREISYLDIDLVLEHFTAIIAQKDQFSMTTASDDGVNIARAGENGTVETLVITSGRWDGLTVEVLTPTGARKTVDKYRYGNLNTQRIYEFVIMDVSYAEDLGDYKFTATDAYGDERQSTTRLHVFTVNAEVGGEEYTGEPGGTVEMNLSVTTETWLILVEVDTPTQGTVPVDNWTESGDNPGVRTYRYIISDVNYERDHGQYTFRVTERIFNEYDYNVTANTNLNVFSVSVEEAKNAYGANQGDSILQIEAFVSVMDEWDVSVNIRTPSGTKAVNEYEIISSTERKYIHTIRDVSTEDEGIYFFTATQTLNQQQYQVQSAEIEVIVKGKEKLSGGEIAGIVIGSIVGAALLLGIGWQISARAAKSVTGTTSTAKTYDNKAAELSEKPEHVSSNDNEKKFVEVEGGGTTSL